MPERKITFEEIAEIEKEFEPGSVPEPIWIEQLRLNAAVTVEVTPYRINAGKVQVYMTRRPSNDRHYANLLHMPGTMCNGSDDTLEKAIARVQQKELSGKAHSEPIKIATFYRKTPRGSEAVFQYLEKIYDDSNDEGWFNAENLPEDTIVSHQEMVKKALESISKIGQKRQTAAFE